MEKPEAWATASGLVEPIVQQHGLEDYKGGANFMTTGSTFSKVEQHIDHILHVAEWLLGDNT